MYSNGIRTSEVAGFNRQGYLTKSVWLRNEERAALQKEDSQYRAFMPPLVGTQREVDALADYLHNLISKGGAPVESKTAVRR